MYTNEFTPRFGLLEHVDHSPSDTKTQYNSPIISKNRESISLKNRVLAVDLDKVDGAMKRLTEQK